MGFLRFCVLGLGPSTEQEYLDSLDYRGSLQLKSVKIFYDGTAHVISKKKASGEARSTRDKSCSS